MQGFDGCFIDFDEINPKNYEITRVIGFTENWPKVSKTEPRNCKIYTRNLNLPPSPSRLGLKSDP